MSLMSAVSTRVIQIIRSGDKVLTDIKHSFCYVSEGDHKQMMMSDDDTSPEIKLSLCHSDKLGSDIRLQNISFNRNLHIHYQKENIIESTEIQLSAFFCLHLGLTNS